LVAEFYDSAREALGGSILVESGKVESARAAIGYFILKQIMRGGKDGNGHCQDSSFRTTAGSQP